MKSKIGIIIKREYSERVRKKSFIVTTLLMPLFFVAIMIAPALITMFTSPEETRIAVVDDSGIIAPTLRNDNGIEFISVTDNLNIVKNDDSIDGILVIGKNFIEMPTDVALYTHNSSTILKKIYLLNLKKRLKIYGDKIITLKI